MAIKYDIDLVRAQWALGRFLPEDLPAVAWDALEMGFDGPALRRLAALDRPSRLAVGELFNQAIAETGRKPLTLREAAVLLGKQVARRIVSGEVDPIDATLEMEHLYLDGDLPIELYPFIGLDQDFQRAVIVEEAKKLLR